MLSILAVDDEGPALDELSYLLRSSDMVGGVFVARSATDALRQLRNETFDVILLDIQMPGLDGLELARILSRFVEPPAVVFVTAHEEHALEAFDVGASGYLLKPVDRERLERVLRRAVGPGAEETESIPVESGGRTVIVARQDISWVEAAGDYVRLHLRTGNGHLLRASMSTLEEEWSDFVRVHRSYLVALRDITELRTDETRTTVVVGDTELPVSRRHLRESARSPRSTRPTRCEVSDRQLVRAPERRRLGARTLLPIRQSPVADDLYGQDDYARTLLRSLMRAQLGATVSVLVPAAALLILYPMLAVLFPALDQAQISGVPLTFLVLGGGIYPPLVLLGFWYRRRAGRVEDCFAELLDERDD